MAREIHKPKTDFTDLQKNAQTLAENFMKTPGFTTLEEPAIIREGISHGETDNNSKGELPMKELQEKGQIYDFRNDTDMAEEIAVELESMNPKELNRLKTEMHRVLAESRKEQEKESGNWFNQAVVPVLKDFVEQSEACLDLSEDGVLEVTAVIRNRGGVDINEKDHRMKMLLLLANHISIERCDEDLLLVLAFELESFFR